jgi:hypothetical protein
LVGIKGTTFVRSLVQTAQTGDKQYIVRYVGRKTKRSIKRRLRRKTDRKVLSYI